MLLTAGDKFLYRAIATDLNADDLTDDLVLKPEGMAVAPNGTISWRPVNTQVGKHQVIARVTDGRGVDLQTFEVEVKQGNRAPTFTSIAPTEARIRETKRFEYQAKALDLDSDTITYSIVSDAPNSPVGLEINPTTGLVSWTPTSEQLGGALNPGYTDGVEPWQILVKATDGKGGEAFQAINIIVDPLKKDPLDPTVEINNAPQIISKPRTSISLGNNYFYKINAVDPDGDALTYTLDNAPTEMSINNGVLVWTPTANQFGNNSVVVRVSDGTVATTQSFSINVGNAGISAEPINKAPEISSTPGQITNLEHEYQYNLTGSDADGDLLLWSLDTAPAGMVIDATTGALRWQPRADQLRWHTVQIRLTDAYGAFVGQEFSLIVNGINTPPQINSTPKFILQTLTTLTRTTSNFIPPKGSPSPVIKEIGGNEGRVLGARILNRSNLKDNKLIMRIDYHPLDKVTKGKMTVNGSVYTGLTVHYHLPPQEKIHYVVWPVQATF